MSELHEAYLNLGSNIQPESNLPKALDLLSHHGEIIKVSSVWESESIGAEGPNFLNVCILIRGKFSLADLKEKVIDPIESALGRVRRQNRYAPRTIDIDIVLFDGISPNDENWSLPFIVIPLAEIFPEYKIPAIGEPVSKTAARLRQTVWMETRPLGGVSRFALRDNSSP